MLTFTHISQLSSIEHGITEKGDVVPQHVVQGEQVHKNKAVWIEHDSELLKRGVDALLTRKTDLTLGVRVADCVPILLADERSGIIGTIHAGWRGTALDIAMKTIEYMNIRPQKTLVGIGPGICANCFEVGEEVARQFDTSVVRESDEEEGKFFIDLAQANVIQLVEAGVPERNIEVMDLCTHEEEKLYSFRQGDREDRNIAFIRRTK